MKMYSHFALGAVLALGALTAGATDTTDYTKWVQLIRNDTNAAPKDTTGYSHAGPSFWSNNAKPSTAYNYYVPVGMTNMTPDKGKGPFTFGGAKLAIAGSMWMCTASGKRVNYRELRLLPGSTLSWRSVGTIGTDRGVVVAMGTEDAPSLLQADFDYSSGYAPDYMISNVTSAADGVLKIVNGCSTNLHWWTFLGSLADFQGKLIMADPLAYYRTANFTQFPGTLVYAANGRPALPEGFPGKVAVGSGYCLTVDNVATNKNSMDFSADAGGTLYFGSSRSVKSLSMAATSTLKLDYAKGAVDALTVTEDLSLAAGTIVDLSGLAIADCTGTPKVLKLMTLASGVTVPDVSGLKLKPVVGVLPRGIFSVRDGENGAHELCVTWKSIVTLEDVSGIADKDFFTYASNGYRWSSGKIPEADNDYLIFGKSGFTWSSPKGQVNFLGDSLTFCNQSIYLGTGNIKADDFTVDGFSFTSYGNDRHWRGGLYVGPGGMSGTFYQGNTFYIDSTVSGVGDFKFACRTAKNTNLPFGAVELTGINTAFGGSVWVNTPFSPVNGTKPATPDVENGYLMKIYVTDGRNLGGPWQGTGSWGYNAIHVDNFGRLIARNSVTFDEPTRGFFIDVCTRMEAPSGTTMAIKNPITYAGELRWEGEGTLALGGPVWFKDGEEITHSPVAGSNVLHIVSGGLMPLSTNSFDGLKLVFEADATLKIDLNPTDEGLRDYGLYNLAATSWELPASKQLKVELEGASPVNRSGRIALFTITKDFESTSGISVNSVVLSTVHKAFSFVVTRQENSEAQTVTYFATYEPVPTQLIFR